MDKDVMSKSDPMAVVMIFKDGNWFEVNCARIFGSFPILRTCFSVCSQLAVCLEKIYCSFSYISLIIG